MAAPHAHVVGPEPGLRRRHFTRGWLLREQDEIVGFLGAIPWKFQLGGHETTVFAGTTWRVLPEYRGMSIALKRQQMEEHGDVLHLSTTPRAEVERLLKLLGYEPMRTGEGDEAHSAIILDFEKLLRAKLNGRASVRALAKGAAPPLAAIQSTAHAATAAVARTRKSARSIRPTKRSTISGSGRSHDTRAPMSALRRRSTGTAFRRPISRKRCLDTSTATGWRVTSCSCPRNGAARGSSNASTCGSKSGPRREVVLGALIEKARRFAEESSFDRMYLPHFDQTTAATYGRLGLLQMRGPRRPGFYMGPSELMHQLTPANSYLVLAEGDYGL